MKKRSAAGGPITLDTRVVVSGQQVSCDLSDEAVVLSLRDGAYYGMNPVAADIWQLIQQPRTVSAIRDELLAEYDGVSPEQCAEEVVALIGQLLEWEMVEIVELTEGAAEP